MQYWRYMKGIVLHFDFGYSYQNSQPVRDEIFQRLPATISLTVGAVVVWLLIGLPSASSPPSGAARVLDRTAMGGALLAISAPVYWLGLVALFLFANDIGVVTIFDGAGTYTRAHRRTRRLVRLAAVAMARAGRELRGLLRSIAAGEPDRGDVGGLHPHGARQGAVASDG